MIRRENIPVAPRTGAVPAARAAVADPQLVRPDWTQSTARDPRLLWLDKNENADPQLAALVQRVVAEVDPVSLSTYPDCAPLYHKLASYLGTSADRLLLSAGSDGVIRSVFEAFVNSGDVVIHTAPTFAMYSVYSRMYGARAATVEYQASDKGPQLRAADVIAVVERARPKIVCLPNPDSPTGTAFDPGDLRSIIEASGRAGALILIDEAYHPFHDFTVLPWLEEYPHLVIARTFAKAWGLAGLRIGYAVSAPAITGVLHKVRPMYEVNTLAVAAAERMLDFSGEMLASVRRLNAGRDAFLASIEKLGLSTIHAKGNFLHVAFGRYARAVHEALKDLVLYRKDFAEPCLSGYSRFSSTTWERFRPVAARISEAVGVQRRIGG